MLNKIKGLLIGLLKSQVTKNLDLLDTLAAPELSKLLVEKAKLPKDQSDALAKDITAIVKTQITVLLGKI